MKWKVLYLCSWLDMQTKRGFFFIEHGHMLKEHRDIELVHFVKFTEVKIPKLITTILLGGLTITNESGIILYETLVPKIKNENKFSILLTKVVLYRQWKNIINKYDIIHAQSLIPAAIYGSYLSRKYNKPLFVTEHNQLNLFSSKFTRKTIQKALNNCKERLVVSVDLIRQFASNGIFYSFKVLHNPLHPTFISYEVGTASERMKDLPNANRSIIIAHTGAYTPIKNQDAILRLLKRIDLTHSYNITLNWLGYNSWGQDSLKKLREAIENQKYSPKININLQPIVSKVEIAKTLSEADMYICTSICETFGLGSLEALAMGVPLLTTDNGGAREFAHSRNSVIVPIASDCDLYNGFVKIVETIDSFDKLAISEEIRGKFTPKNFVDGVINSYNNILK